jgi:hypothetical protein
LHASGPFLVVAESRQDPWKSRTLMLGTLMEPWELGILVI